MQCASLTLVHHIDLPAQIDAVNLRLMEVKSLRDVDTDFIFILESFHVVNQNVKQFLGLAGSIRLSLVRLGIDVYAMHRDVPELSAYKDVLECNGISKCPDVYHVHLVKVSAAKNLCFTLSTNCNEEQCNQRAGVHDKLRCHCPYKRGH